MSRERLSHGGAIQRRRVLAQTRRKGSLGLGERLERDRDVEVTRRLNEAISEILRSESESVEQKRIACLGAGQIWREFAFSARKQEEQSQRQSQLQLYLNVLKEENPEIYAWLRGEGSPNSSGPLVKIRDAVIPPTIVQGFYTKRHL